MWRIKGTLGREQNKQEVCLEKNKESEKKKKRLFFTSKIGFEGYLRKMAVLKAKLLILRAKIFLGEEKDPENRKMKVSGKARCRVYAIVINQKQTKGRCRSFLHPILPQEFLRPTEDPWARREGELVRT